MPRMQSRPGRLSGANAEIYAAEDGEVAVVDPQRRQQSREYTTDPGPPPIQMRRKVLIEMQMGQGQGAEQDWAAVVKERDAKDRLAQEQEIAAEQEKRRLYR